jgi:GntR family transcriptional regulator/MocR family aminotransferase
VRWPKWAAANGTLVIEHDYDAHYRYDQLRASALQALAPEHVAYVGSTTALLAPAIRLGWSVLPARLVEPVAHQLFADVIGTPRLTQLALAEFIARGYLDRHLRRTGAAFKTRRETLVRALAERLPQATPQGRAAGLYASFALPEEADEAKLLAAARRRGIALDGFNEHATFPQRPGLVLGFASAPEPTLERGAALLEAAWEEAMPA